MKTRKNRLHDYSLFATVLLLSVNKLDGQIIYTDVEPDIEFDFGFKNLDLDDNGVNDYKFIKESIDTSNTSDIICYSNKLFEIGTLNLNNYIAGISYTFDKDIITPLDFGLLIYDGMEFNGDAWQYQTIKVREETCVYGAPNSPWFYPNIGGWHADEGEDKYIGVKFKGDTPDCYYYGWIRCVISDSLEKMTIKDYAYNANCGEGLLAGTFISDIDTFNQQEPIISVQNDVISIKTAYNAKGAGVIVTAITGQLVHHSTIAEIETFIPTNHFSAGMYLVSINITGQVYVKKVVIK
ncbi:MAG: T9SS type A sorting domain-containing protein [Chitinophagales bacterium]|jgi:hypothetical protein|nr:T9SS type A sorting domain-containing protein [Bacteroidota bacterium]MBK9555415.1 T9SS type A sorting domain-containing protein [Bacteroidota bacterium]MBL0279739.1 T9SS type A sorting domain-containing protein [Bacteroidota bacterium]MBP8248627.1 T9SS type A sorting domain-containing protein [Chitinophagales bacterium]MBP9879382.1 T9SS type A sorting domain-containing protein [Chitinophagales bacterium]